MAQLVRSHSSHWGAYETTVENDTVTSVRPFAGDVDPSPILGNIASTVRHRSRVTQPMVRTGWLEHGPVPDSCRGSDKYVPVSWPELTDLLSRELRRVIDTYGNRSIYAGSYGWASAGRFHHAQSQVHRFLNVLGGYVSSVNSYSNGAGEVILDRVTGSMRSVLATRSTSWQQIVEHTDLLVAFGGVPLKNSAVSPGGQSFHGVSSHLRNGKERGTEYVLFSPLRDDLPDYVDATWNPLVPGTDVAVMLGLAHTLASEGLHDRAFLASHCHGYDRFERYLLGDDDGQPKDADWAEAISQIPSEEIRSLARKMVAGRTMINVSWSLQRADHGEQPVWMGLTLAAMLGQIGLPGGGFGFGYGSMGSIGEGQLPFSVPSFSQGHNAVDDFIPVARVADMLLNPGRPFDYDGETLTYPEIKLVYWAGGNPFHHHQDLSRLRKAIAQAETVVVHDPFWTAMAKHADIVVPSTISLERDDLGASYSDPVMIAMKKAVEPFESSRNDFDTFSDLSEALGVHAAFTEGRGADEWIRHLYESWRSKVTPYAPDIPEFDVFWEDGYLDLPYSDQSTVAFSSFRADPIASPLRTPSGKIDIYSDSIASFDYDDCIAHPVWYEPKEWPGSVIASQFPLQLVANNPSTRLHSQLDPGTYSQASKIKGREPARMHPDDAASRGIAEGDVVKLFNERGSCLAGVRISRNVRPGVIQLSTGAWFDPLDPTDPNSMCVHGNPNVLTFDQGTSRLGQGCAGQLALVQVERFDGELPPILAYDPPVVSAAD